MRIPDLGKTKWKVGQQSLQTPLDICHQQYIEIGDQGERSNCERRKAPQVNTETDLQDSNGWWFLLELFAIESGQLLMYRCGNHLLYYA